MDLLQFSISQHPAAAKFPGSTFGTTDREGCPCRLRRRDFGHSTTTTASAAKRPETAGWGHVKVVALSGLRGEQPASFPLDVFVRIAERFSIFVGDILHNYSR